MQKYNHRKQTKNSRLPLAIGLLFFSIFIFLAFVSFRVLTLDKFIYVNRIEGGDAEIVVIDSKSSVNTKFKIDKDIQFQSARGYGEYKLSSLWQLGDREGLGGKLVAESVVKNMYLPVYLWKNEKDSNLSFFQKIKAYFVGSNSSNYEANLSLENIPSSVYINFVDPDLNVENLKIEVQDLTGEYGTIDQISKIIEVSGSKITTNTKGYEENLDCEISGNLKNTVDLFSKVLGCKELHSDKAGIVIRLGAKFAERF